MFDQSGRYRDFVLIQYLQLHELNATLVEVVHEPTEARIVQIQNEDIENLFCLSFATRPSSSNGVAHILEHVILCGSKKFPVKDPFFFMTRRSLHTFMNAFTGPDFTCYPAASQVEKDFYNLLEVYLDAVFYPQLKKESFLQEGCRLSLVNSTSAEPLEWKGVVYNEMKGALLSPDSRLWYVMMKALLPELTYAHVSGGTPEEIPSLTYEELLNFYQIHYHPSRCLFFFYGSLPLKNHLNFIEERVLKNVSPLSSLPPIATQSRLEKPIYKKEFYPLVKHTSSHEKIGDQKVIFAVGWLTIPIQEQEVVLALSLLNLILMGTDASLLRLPLLQSGLCSATDGYLDTDISEIPYLIVCKGCVSDQLEALEFLIFDSLNEIVRKGIPSHLIEAAFHQLEFSRKEISGDRIPFGLSLFMRSVLAKQHGCPLENALVIHTLFDRLRRYLTDPAYLSNIIQNHLIQNPHRVCLEMHPDPNLTHKEMEEEKRILQKIYSSLSPEEKENIEKEERRLTEYQEKVENQNIDCLPKINLEDVPILTSDFPLRQKEAVFFHPTFTNQLIYVDFVFDLPYLDEEELPYVALLAAILPELGMGNKSYEESLEHLQSHVGGLSMTLSLHVQADSPFHMKPAVAVHIKALERNLPYLFSTLKEFLLRSRFDEVKRIQNLILQLDTELHHRFQKNSLRYAAQLALSSLSLPEKILEQWRGLPYFKKIQQLSLSISHSGEERNRILEKLNELKERIFSFHQPHLVISCDESLYSKCEQEGFFGILELPKKFFTPWKGEYSLKQVRSQGRIIPSPVAFTCEAFKVASFSHPHAAALALTAHLLDQLVLFPNIRERGGAYGCGATYNSVTGSFYFHASRDPHILSTLNIFKKSIEVIANGEFDALALEAAKLEALQDLDMPIDPGNRGKVSYNRYREGKTVYLRQSHRDRLLALTSEEVVLAVQKELLLKMNESIIVTFANQLLLEKENKGLEKPLPITSI